MLGGCGVNLLELTNLYAGLANMGMFSPYKILKKDENDIGKQKRNETELDQAVSPTTSDYRLLKPETSWIVTEMLTTLKRPDFPRSL